MGIRFHVNPITGSRISYDHGATEDEWSLARPGEEIARSRLGRDPAYEPEE